MRILVACEESQAVTVELRRLGHEAYSCDIEPCSGGHPEWHIQGDALPIINGNCEFETADGHRHRIDGKWDLLIAHPPCTYFSTAGANWLFRGGKLDEERYKKGLAFASPLSCFNYHIAFFFYLHFIEVAVFQRNPLFKKPLCAVGVSL